MFTARFEHDFSDNVTIRNTTRYGRLRAVLHSHRRQRGERAHGRIRTTWTVNRTRQAKFQENTLLTNQTNVTANLVSGSVNHAITGGFEFIDEEQFNPAYAPLSLGVAPPANVYNPNRNDRTAGLCAGAQRRVHARRNANRRRLHLRHDELRRERWQVTGGFRLDAFDTETDGAALSTLVTHPTLPVGTLVPTSLEADDTLFSYKIGVLYKPRAQRQHLSVACHVAAAAGRREFHARLHDPAMRTAPISSPPKARTSSSGAKWEFRDGALAVTGALFDSANKNELMPDATDPAIFVQVGEREVKGSRARHRRQAHRQLGLLRRHRQDGYRDRPGQRHADRLADQLVARAHVLELDHVHARPSVSPSAVARATSTRLRARSTPPPFRRRPTCPPRPNTGWSTP